MASVETSISEIQGAFVELSQVVSSLRNREIIEEKDALDFLGLVVDFQRKLEYYKESISIFSGRAYFERAQHRFQTVIYYFSTEATIHEPQENVRHDQYQVYVSGDYFDYLEGIAHETKDLLERARHGSMSAVHRSLWLIDDLLHQEVQTGLIELYGDLRLLASLAIFPIEEKLKIKGQLVDSGFKQVVEFLEIAEENYGLTPPHLKDTLSNCRNALEATITILLDHFDLKPTQKFSIDAGALQGSGFLDRETKDVVLSMWSYLSMKGSHSYSVVDKKSISDVDFGLDQTYRVIAQLMTKYQSHSKSKA